MSDYTYYVNVERQFTLEEYEANLHNEYILGEWEGRMPQNLVGEWSGHGTAFGYRKLTLKNLFKGRKHRCYIRSYDVSFDVKTAEEGAMLVEQLKHLTKDEQVRLRLGCFYYPKEEE